MIFRCQMTTSIWRLVWNKELSRVSFNSCFVDWWISLSSSCSKEEIELISFRCWAIWLDRNKIIHDSPVPNLEVCNQWILNYAKDFAHKSFGSRGLLPPQPLPHVSEEPIRWCPPPANFLKLNVDVAWSPLPQTMGQSVILRDYNGSLLLWKQTRRMSLWKPLQLKYGLFQKVFDWRKIWYCLISWWNLIVCQL